jgi:LDH2 family malate/lactate/ureidoglycolate dehydrogenase
MATLQDFVRVNPDEAEAFGRRLLLHHGLPQEDATIVAQCLVRAARH